MYIIDKIKQELRCINIVYPITGAGIVFLLGIISWMFTGPTYIYHLVLRPRSAPPTFIFPLMWSLMYILIGAGAGAVCSKKARWATKHKYIGLLLFSLMMCFCITWAPLFFRGRSFFISLLVLAIIMVLCFYIMRCFVHVYLVSAISIIIFQLWLLYLFWLNFCILILN